MQSASTANVFGVCLQALDGSLAGCSVPAVFERGAPLAAHCGPRPVRNFNGTGPRGYVSSFGKR